MKELSILIPTYNDECATLVSTLQRQAEEAGVAFEIIVADDGSTSQEVLAANRHINQLPHCRLMECSQNRGRSAIRNFLVQQAQYEWVIFIDSDMVVCREDFIRKYVEADGPVVYGGVVIGNVQNGNLRSLYEKKSEHQHTAQMRQQSPYQDFHTANFMIRRDIMLANLFDSRFTHYGYEDVLLGKSLKAHSIPILHIDNPLSFEIYESNTDFVNKTEEGLRTLYQFRNELQGYSRMLTWADKFPHLPIRLWHQFFGKWERSLLTGSHPRLSVFNLYKLGYFISLYYRR